MDYEKKYKKALDNANVIHKCGNNDVKHIIEQLFPELVESKDERIRKEIIDYINRLTVSPNNIDKYNTWIAWLDKQGEQKTQHMISKEVMDAYLGRDKIETMFKQGDIVRLKNGDGLEWTIKEVHNDGYYTIVCADRDDFIQLDSHWELVEPQPKFNVGYWIVNNNSGGIYQVTEIIDNEYCLWPLDGEIMGYLGIADVDNDYHLWTIADAKDGDVLVDVYGNIGIIQEYDDFDWRSYCSLGINGGFQNFKVEHENDKTHPATKEHRELFFQKMHEAGFVWDIEKKESKKIEQKPAWSEEDEHRVKDTIYFLDTAKKHYASTVELNACIDWLKSLKDRIRIKQELSEEDKHALMYKCVHKAYRQGYNTGHLVATTEMEHNQEWSEEDEEFINDLIGVFDGQQYQAHSDEEIVKWLKSIRLPYNKEWDENDEEMLKSIIATCELACEDRDSSPAKHLLEMQTNWLKSLRPQNRWKPSDEQIETLEHFVRSIGESGYTSPYDNNTKLLCSLLSDLKKLTE